MASKTLIAFDHMRVPLSYLEWGYKVNALYKELLNDGDQKSQESEDEAVDEAKKVQK